MALSGKTKTLYLVCDVSGSMGEGGKNMLMRGIARAVEQYVRLDYGAVDIKLVLWNTDATVVQWNPDDEFPDQLLRCEGSANAAALCEVLGSQLGGNILILTDGWWSIDDASCLKKWKRTLQSNTLRIIKIGADANPLLTKNDVFSGDDLLAALDGWLPQADAVTSNEDADEW